MIDQLISIDQRLFLTLNGLNSPFFDFIMFWLSDKLIWIPLYAWLLYMMIKENKKRAWLLVLFIALLVTLTDQISVQLFKDVFHRLRPCHEPGLDGLVRILNGHCGGSYGFVSSHACNTAGVAVFSGLMLKHRLKWLFAGLLGWSALVSYSRIYLGVHYPGDVLTGFLVGATIGYFVFIMYVGLNKKLNERRLS